MKKLIIFLIILLVGVIVYDKYGQINDSVNLSDGINNQINNSDNLSNTEDFEETEKSTKVNIEEADNITEPFCESYSGKKLYLSDAQNIASSSFCSSQGTITEEYSCETKNGNEIFALVLNAKPSRFGEPGEVCVTRCEIVIDSGEVNGNKQCK